MPARYVYGLAIAGSGIGMTAGFLVARKTDISAGDAALVNSGGTWGTATRRAAGAGDHPQPVGVAVRLVHARRHHRRRAHRLAAGVEARAQPRGHVGLIDVGGLAGTGLGFALGYVIGVNSQSEDDIQTGARYALGGMALGLLAGAVLTRKYKGDVPPVEALLHHEHGRWAVRPPRVLRRGRANRPRHGRPALLAHVGQGKLVAVRYSWASTIARDREGPRRCGSRRGEAR